MDKFIPNFAISNNGYKKHYLESSNKSTHTK